MENHQEVSDTEIYLFILIWTLFPVIAFVDVFFVDVLCMRICEM